MEVMRQRRRMPAVRRRSIQDCLEASISRVMTVFIWAISALTNSELGSPSAWYLTRIALASSVRSWVMSHRGLSGRKLGTRDVRCLHGESVKVDVVGLQDEADLQERGADLEQRRDAPGPVARDVVGAEADGRCCDLANKVGDVEAVEMSAAFWRYPNVEMDYRDVRTGRSLGYPSSPIKDEPETIQVGIPKPRIMRATMYMPTAGVSATTISNCGVIYTPCCENPWIRAPRIMIQLPPKMDHRRPNLSLTIGIKGSDRIAPSEYAAAMMPFKLPSGFPKSSRHSQSRRCFPSSPLPCDYSQSFQGSTICSALIICESKPDVSSMPMHVGKSIR